MWGRSTEVGQADPEGPRDILWVCSPSLGRQEGMLEEQGDWPGRWRTHGRSGQAGEVGA